MKAECGGEEGEEEAEEVQAEKATTAVGLADEARGIGGGGAFGAKPDGNASRRSKPGGRKVTEAPATDSASTRDGVDEEPRRFEGDAGVDGGEQLCQVVLLAFAGGVVGDCKFRRRVFPAVVEGDDDGAGGVVAGCDSDEERAEALAGAAVAEGTLKGKGREGREAVEDD